MARRLVTAEDKEKYPYLNGMGISVNMAYDFPEEDEQQQPLKRTSIKVPEGTVTTIHVPNNVHEHRYKEHVPPPPKKQEAKKVVKKETEAPVNRKAPIQKKEEIKKPVPVKSAKPVKAPAKKIAPVKKLVPKKTGKKGK